MNEVWRPIPGFGNSYEASSLGRIRSINRIVTQFADRCHAPIVRELKGRLLSIQKRPLTEYLYVNLNVCGVSRNQSVHKLVALAFHGIPEIGMQVRHLNGNPKDNSSNNLAWGTFSENQADIDLHGTRAKGEGVGTSKLTVAQVLEIKKINSPTLAIRLFGIGRSQYYRIKRGHSWSHTGQPNAQD